ncbi:hypothetical protein PGO_082480 [Plasmodium gonderi]|uniref:Uncharacterized protein n=1 Tax=Plasmodium gonderi TaxID=77519 RepID=A0A1Y1JIR4_PLAGO|nr:hypothetical protein PGO_082480 [Plasmodium gonderi]GAW80682.1 hypothetical protein PGO_082480 [Plasmodium gonderi]
MLEILCIDLINELFITKHKFLLAMKLNNLLNEKYQNWKKDEIDKTVKVESPTLSQSNAKWHIPESPQMQGKHGYSNFSNLKKDETRRKKKKIINFKKLRKHIVDINEYCDAYCWGIKSDDKPLNCHTACRMNCGVRCTPYSYARSQFVLRNYEKRNFILNKKERTLIKKIIHLHIKEKDIVKNKKYSFYLNNNEETKGVMNNSLFENPCNQRKDNLVDILNDELSEYITKDFYPFLPLHNFTQESQPPNKKSLSYLINMEKINEILKRKNKIKSTLPGKYMKRTVLLSSKKLNKHYIKFITKFRLFIKKIKEEKHKSVYSTHLPDVKYTILKTLLYLKGGSTPRSTTSSGSSSGASCRTGNINQSNNNSAIRDDIQCEVLPTRRPTSRNVTSSAKLNLNNGKGKGEHYEIYQAISTIHFLKKSLYIIRMDVMYIFIFLMSYVNSILSKLKNGRLGVKAKMRKKE